MPPFDYAEARTVATELIAEFGAPAVLRKQGASTGPAYDPTPGTATFHQLTVVDLEQRLKDREGSLIGETTRTLYIAAEGVEPAKGDRVKLGATAAGMTDAAFTGYMEIGEIRTLSPAGTVVMYEADLLL